MLPLAVFLFSRACAATRISNTSTHTLYVGELLYRT